MFTMPAPAGVLAPLLLAGVLVVSALAKWRQPESTRSAIVLLRLPRALHTAWVAKALPPAEGLLALVMILSPVVWLTRLASWASAVLFVAYLAIIVRAMTFTPRPDCGCFGNIGDQRVRGRTVWRNALFVALAAVFLWFSAAGHTVPDVLLSLGFTGWAWLLGAVVASVAVALIGPGASGTRPPRPTGDARVAGTAPGEDDLEDYIRQPIPRAVLVDPAGQGQLLQAMAASRAQLLVFVNCYCGPTHAVIRDVPLVRPQVPQIDVRVVFSGVDVLPSTPELPTADAWRDFGAITWETLGLQASPSAVLLGADGLLAGGPVGGLDAVREFFDEVAEALSGAPVVPVHPIQVVTGQIVTGEIHADTLTS